MASVVSNLSGSMQAHADMRVHSNTKTTPVDRTLMQGIQAQLALVLSLAKTIVGWRPKILHIHTSSYNTFWRTALDTLIGKLLGRKVVLHIHGAQFHLFLGELGVFGSTLARATFALADCTLVLGDVWKQRLSPWCPPHKMRILPNGVPVRDIPPPDKPFSGRVLCVANYERRKGLEDLVRAVATICKEIPVTLTVVGAEMEAGHRQQLQALAGELGVSNRVNLSGPVPIQEIGAWYEQADIFCLPSYNEGLPMSLLEAMATSLPLVASSVGAVPQLVRDGVDGYLFEAGDRERLTALLLKLLKDPQHASALGRNGRQRIVEDFSLEAVSEQLASVYSELGQ
jgi:glycosyltransferase involved in cell wall biosynthesis